MRESAMRISGAVMLPTRRFIPAVLERRSLNAANDYYTGGEIRGLESCIINLFAYVGNDLAGAVADIIVDGGVIDASGMLMGRGVA